jgi:PAS domain S-box-containing protein
MNDVSEQAVTESADGDATPGSDIRQFLATALRSATGAAAYLVHVERTELAVMAMARTVDGKITVHQANNVGEALADLDPVVIRQAIVTKSPAVARGVKGGQIVCIPVDIRHRSERVLCLILKELAPPDLVEELEWLASAFAASCGLEDLRDELGSVREDAAEVERELRRNLDMIPALTWVGGPGGELLEASSQWHEYTGISREDALGLGFLASFHPDDVEKVVTAWTDLLVTGKPGGIEARIVRHDGEARYFMLRAVPHFDDEGNVRKWYGVNADIDDLKRAEFELAKSQAVMAEAQRIIETGSWSWDMVTDVFTCSAECTKIVGLPSQEITFETLMERVHPDDREMVAAAHGNALQGAVLDVEHRFVLPDGSVKFIHARGRLMYEYDDTPRAYIGTIVDVTEARRSEDRIRSSLAEAQRAQASLAEAQKLSHVGSFRIKPLAGEIIWSAETYNIYGLDPSLPLRAETIIDRIHPDDRERISQIHARCLRDGLPWEAEHRLIMPDGSIKHVHCFTRVEADPEQEPEVFGAIIDQTERITSEEALRKAQSDLARMNRLTAMGAVTVSIAHEMNQPLMAIVTNAATCLSWLDRPEPDIAEAKTAAERIVSEGRRAGDVLLNVRNMARNSRPSMTTVDVNDVIGDVLAMLRSELRSRRIDATVHLSPRLRPIRADRVQLQQVTLNLMLNAVEAMAEHQDVRVLTVESDDGPEGVIVRVQDNGRGIDPVASERIFEAFYSTKPGGTGMGLAICRSIVEAHNGTLGARRLPEGGSVFEFKIPYARGADEPETT